MHVQSIPELEEPITSRLILISSIRVHRKDLSGPKTMSGAFSHIQHVRHDLVHENDVSDVIPDTIWIWGYSCCWKGGPYWVFSILTKVLAERSLPIALKQFPIAKWLSKYILYFPSQNWWFDSWMVLCSCWGWVWGYNNQLVGGPVTQYIDILMAYKGNMTIVPHKSLNWLQRYTSRWASLIDLLAALEMLDRFLVIVMLLALDDNL